VDFATLKDLVARSQLREAARQLAGGLADTPRLHSAAIQLQERLSRLEGRELKGIVSPAEASLERNRISDALLQLGAQLDVPADARKLPDAWTEGIEPHGKSIWRWVVGAAVVLLLLALAGFSYWQRNRPFDLRAYIYGPQGESQPVSKGLIKLQMGAYMADGLWEGKPGQVLFPDIPARFRKDSIHLFPLGLPQWQKDTQLGHTYAEAPIRLQLKAAATHWRGLVRDANGVPLAGALVIADGDYRTRTDSLGHFQLLIGRPEGSRVQVRVRVDGRERYNKQKVLSGTTPAELILNPL